MIPTLSIAPNGCEYDNYDRHRARIIVNNLTVRMIELMERHSDGPQAVFAGSPDQQITLCLVGRHLLTYDRGYRPRTSTATTLGKLVISLLLASEADRLLEGAAT